MAQSAANDSVGEYPFRCSVAPFYPRSVAPTADHGSPHLHEIQRNHVSVINVACTKTNRLDSGSSLLNFDNTDKNVCTLSESSSYALYANSTPFFSVPISETCTSITVPGFKYLGSGFCPEPTPPGVPVMITLPFCNVVPCEK